MVDERKIKDYYNSKAYVEKAAKFAVRVRERRLTTINRNLKINPEWKTLEVGCGAGIYSKDFPNWTGLDISEEAVKGLNAVVASADSIPFPDNSFDLVLMFDTLEHLYKPKESLDECCRVLKKGGFLVLDNATLFYAKLRMRRLFLPELFSELLAFLGFRVNLRPKWVKPDYTKYGEEHDAVYLTDNHNILFYLLTNHPLKCLNKNPFPLSLYAPTKENMLIFKKS